jgi:hypothetical protein
MLLLKYAMLTGAVALFITAMLVVLFEALRVWQLSRTMGPDEWPEPRPLLWGKATRLTALACLVMLPALRIAVIPSGMAGVGVAQVTHAGDCLPEGVERRVLSSRPCTEAAACCAVPSRVGR